MCRGVVSVCPRHPWQVHPLSECKNPKIRLSVSLAGRVELPDFLSATGVDELLRSFASPLRGLPPCPQFPETDFSEASPSDWTSAAVTSFTFGKRICWSSGKLASDTNTVAGGKCDYFSPERIENGKVPAEFPFRHGYQIDANVLS